MYHQSFECIIYPFHGQLSPAFSSANTNLQHKKQGYVKTHCFNLEIRIYDFRLTLLAEQRARYQDIVRINVNNIFYLQSKMRNILIKEIEQYNEYN